MRLRQYLANRYASSEAVNAEFENVIRYINSAELGNFTVAELLKKIFDEDGELNLGLAFRFNASTGIEVRIDSDSDEWELLVPVADIRGPAGGNVGTVQGPLFFNRVDVTATAGQTAFDYTIVAEAADVLVWINGVLQGESDYGYNATTSKVTLSTGANLNDLVTLVSIRTDPSTAYRRADMLAATGQVTFPFPFDEYEELVVFVNGIFQREGGGFDYIKTWQTGTITMTTPRASGDLVTVMCITNKNIREVAGLMLEDNYTDGAGMIRLDRVAIDDGALTQAMVNGLVTELASKARIFVQPGTPATPIPGDFWVNTSTAIPSLNFYDGVRWLNAAPNGMIPLPVQANALQYVRLNSTATALEYAALDLSGYLQNAMRGAANGVAPLDAAGLVPASALPAWCARAPIIGSRPGALTNGTYVVGVFDNIRVFDGLTAILGAGTATLQLQVNGVNVGATLAASNAAAKLAINATQVDATGSPKTVALVVTGASTASDLSFNIGSLITGP